MINKGKVLSLRKVKNFDFFSKNKIIILMCFVFIIGVIVSILAFDKKGNIFNWEKIIKNFYIERTSLTYFKVFIRSFFNFFTVIVLLFIFGTSIVGIGISPVVVCVLGFVSGGISSYLYSVYALKGIAFNSLVVLPVSVLFFTVCFFAAKTSVMFSYELSALTLKRTGSLSRVDYKKYCTDYFFYLVFTGIISAVDMLFSKLFIKLFNF